MRQGADPAPIWLLVLVTVVASLAFTVSQQEIISTPGFKPLHRGFLSFTHAFSYTCFARLELHANDRQAGSPPRSWLQPVVPWNHYGKEVYGHQLSEATDAAATTLPPPL